jgi:hypothetical protein
MKALSILASVLVGAGAFVLAGPNADAATVTVTAGQSIQTAIDNASSGDTISVGPGVFAPFVVYKDNLRIVGHNTVVQPTSTSTFYGVCINPDSLCAANSGSIAGVTITGITVRGVDGSGFLVRYALGATLTLDVATGNFSSGFTVSLSQGTTVSQSTATGSNYGFSFDQDDGATYTGDQANKDGVGFSGSISAGVTISNSIAQNGCAGVDVDNSSRLIITNDVFASNTKPCPFIGLFTTAKGVGAMLFGDTQVQFTHNAIRGNAAPHPYTTPGGVFANDSGGLLVGSEPGAGNVFASNSFANNAPWDIWTNDTDPATNNFSANACHVSVPTGLC